MRRINYNGEVKIDLGCGPDKKEGYIGVDYVDHGQAIVWDVTKGIPLPDDCLDEVYSSHFIEHIEDNDLGIVRDEILRICKDGALLDFKCPHSDCTEAYWLCHKSLWDERKVKAVFSNGYERDQSFEILDIKIEGIEIQFKIKIKK